MQCIESILRYPSYDGYDFYILHSDLTEEEQGYLFGQLKSKQAVLHFQFVSADLFSSFPENKRYPRLIYYRILAAHLLPKHLDRVLYLDADTIVINSLKELYYKEFGENAYLACSHVRKLLNKVNQYRLGMEEKAMYINSGVLLMNLKYLRENQSIQAVAKYVADMKKRLLLPDQDIITALYSEKTGLLDAFLYNLSDRILTIYNSEPGHLKRDIDWVRENTVIIHYCGKNKPWNKKYHGMLDVFYQELKTNSGC